MSFRSSSAKPNEFATGKYAWMMKTPVPSRIDSEIISDLRLPKTAYVPFKASEVVVMTAKYIASINLGFDFITACRITSRVNVITCPEFS